MWRTIPVQKWFLSCGIEGAKSDSMDNFEELVIETLTAVVEKGIEHSRLTALLDQLELQQP